MFHAFSSDHAPFRNADPKWKTLRGDTAAFHHVPNGITGVETRVPIFFLEGVAKGRISLTRFVALVASEPATTHGLNPRKETIAVGADADIVVIDPEMRSVIRDDALHHNVDYAPYEELEISGWREITMSAGEIIWIDGGFCGATGLGRFLHSASPSPARPHGVAPRECHRTGQWRCNDQSLSE